MNSTCSHCDKASWGGTKRNPSTKCFFHFGCVCEKCGHEAFWLTTRKNPEGRWVCFSLQCDWVSKEYTKSISLAGITETVHIVEAPKLIHHAVASQ